MRLIKVENGLFLAVAGASLALSASMESHRYGIEPLVAGDA